MTDSELVARLCDRDPDALLALYDRYGQCLFSLASWILREQPAGATAAEDVVATVFADAWVDAWDISREGASARAWLTHRVRQRALARRTRAMPLLPEAASAAARRVMKDTLSRVPPLASPDQVEGPAVWLAFFEGLSVAEIGGQLKTGRVAASRALAAGMRLLASHSARIAD